MITKPLLAGKAELDKIKYPVLVSPKLDGIRCLIINGQAVSRTLKPIPNKFIRETLSRPEFDGFDGELMLSNPSASFQEITSAVMSHDGEPDFIYWVFDWVNGSHTIPYKLRKSQLAIWNTTQNNLKCVRRLTQGEVTCEEMLLAYEELMLSKGFEGIMIRDPEGIYKQGRSTTKEGILLKLKRFADSEAVITGFEEKEINQNEQIRDERGYAKRSTSKSGMVPANTLGNFVVMDIKTGIEFKCGSGLNDSLRTEIWANRPKYLNKIIKYKYQEIGVKVAPRCPIFLGFRDPIDL